MHFHDLAPLKYKRSVVARIHRARDSWFDRKHFRKQSISTFFFTSIF